MKASHVIGMAAAAGFIAAASAQPLGLGWGFDADIFNYGGFSSASGFLAGDLMFVEGSDSSTGGDSGDFYSGFLAMVPFSGAFGFDWVYGTSDGANYDRVFFYLNGSVTELTDFAGPPSQQGTFLTAVNAGDVVGIGIRTLDGCCGSGWVEAMNFVPTPGAAGILGIAGLAAARRRR